MDAVQFFFFVFFQANCCAKFSRLFFSTSNRITTFTFILRARENVVNIVLLFVHIGIRHFTYFPMRLKSQR